MHLFLLGLLTLESLLFEVVYIIGDLEINFFMEFSWTNNNNKQKY